MRIRVFTTILLLFSVLSASAQQFNLYSPNGSLTSTINVGSQLTYDLKNKDQILMNTSPLSMTLENGEIWGANSKLSKKEICSINDFIRSPLYKKERVLNKYNELRLSFKGEWGIVFRMYDDGFAYRFFSNKKGAYNIKEEQVQLCFPEDFDAFAAYTNTRKQDWNEQFHSSFENTYTKTKISKLDKERLIILPALFEAPNNIKICFTEVDLFNYPGLYLNTTGAGCIKGVLAAYPKSEEQGGHNMLQMKVTAREAFLAKILGKQQFPWRTFIVSTSDEQLLNNDMSYKLAIPSKIDDLSFIQPGKVAWDWWNDWNIKNVDFEAGINNRTYEYYIDFASKNGIQYVILDEGWAVNKKSDLMQVIPEIDIKHLVDYGRLKNVGIILWAGYYAFEKDMENVCRVYSEMGIKGFKVDFMDRDDQKMVQFVERASATAAKYKLMLDLHGMYKPAGINRTYPNVVNVEGVYGLEQMKWAKDSVDMVTNDLTIPFIRMVAGPLDYTPGAMRNAPEGSYTPLWSQPMSQGTRCRQLALFVVFESPLEMLCDSPSEYLKEQECTDFITAIPTVWDETIALEGNIQKSLTIARRKGPIWYIAGLTNWSKREMMVDLAFLQEGNQYKAIIFKDGINAHRNGTDYIREEKIVTKGDSLNITAMPGGGYVVRIEKL
ncbi:MAG TPA: glycoside hydrolase family 97 protein [Niabella sp.]|nr:glycoside hydrolase family 97 protein [Niabella sp.]